MRTTPETIKFLLSQLALGERIRVRKMFGEYALYCDDKVVALVCQNELYVKLTEPGRTYAPNLSLAEAYPGAKPSLRVQPDKWESGDWLTELIRLTAEALPFPAIKKRK